MLKYFVYAALLIITVLAVQYRVDSGGRMEKATFAGGCFWCMVHPFDRMDGVIKVVSGYTGGTVKNPTYEQVSSGKTGHFEAVEISFNPDKISYATLLDAFWKQIDPTDDQGQFADKGSQYMSAIFYHTDEQRDLAEKSKRKLAASGRFSKPIVTRIIPAGVFFPAEDYHQEYYKKNPERYKEYNYYSGRQPFILKNWGSVKKGQGK